MDRRGFLKVLGVGLPAAVVAEKVGLIEQVRTYFFAPQMGWMPGGLTCEQIVILQLEGVRDLIPDLIERDAALHTRFIDRIAYRQRQATTGELYGVDRSPYPKIDWDKALEI